MNKSILYILCFLTAPFFFIGCDTYDFFDEEAIIGQRAPSVYWEVPISVVRAGDSIAFKAQYYWIEKPVVRTEIWHDVIQNIHMEASCPLVSTFKYNVLIADVQEVRQNSMVSSFLHSDTLWNDESKSYVLREKFPTSTTLTTLSWIKPKEFDEDLFLKLFPDTFETHFRANLYEQMEVDDFRRVFVAAYEMEEQEFIQYVDSTYNENTAGFDYFFKPESIGDVKVKFDEIPFQDLLYKSSDSHYEISYEKTYSLNAEFRGVNSDNVIGISHKKVITLQ